MNNLLDRKQYQLLLEQHTQGISQDEFIKLYTLHCSQHSLDNTPLYQGIPGEHADFIIVKPTADKQSYSNVLIDSFREWRNFPSRTNSIHMSTNRNDSASDGNLYIMIPLDNTPFAYAPCPRFEDCFPELNVYFSSLDGFNLFIEQLNNWEPIHYQTIQQLRMLINSLVYNAGISGKLDQFSLGQKKFIEQTIRTGRSATDLLELYTSPTKHGFKMLKYAKTFDLRNYRLQTRKTSKEAERLMAMDSRSRDRWKFGKYDFFNRINTGKAKREYSLNVELWSQGNFLALKYSTFLKNRELLRLTNIHKPGILSMF